MQNLEHPSITRCLITGYPDNLDVVDPENDEWEDDDDEIYDMAFEEDRERRMGFIA